ncbi:MAG: DUF3467 domain-containing protein [Aggregatilineales bacterium]
MQQPPKKRQLKLELPKDPSATYSNMVIIGHTQNEFIFDFVQIMPNDNRARVQKRIVMTPAHAKLFLNALQDNMGRFEAKHGDINTPPRPQSLAEQLFGGVPGSGEGDDSGDSDTNDKSNDEDES